MVVVVELLLVMALGIEPAAIMAEMAAVVVSGAAAAAAVVTVMQCGRCCCCSGDCDAVWVLLLLQWWL